MSTFTKAKTFYHRHGSYETMMFLLFKFLQRVFNLDRQEVVLLELDNLSDENIALPPGYAGEFIDYETLRRQSANDPELEMNEEFLTEAIEKQDRCYTISTDGRIVSYGWYSQKPTRMNDFYFHFDSQYIYMYNGFTIPKFRSKRLHAVGMASAMRSPQLKNAKAMVSCVERQNLASLKSVYRMGYRRTGSVYMLSIFGHYFNYSTPGCRLTGAGARHQSRARPMETREVKV